MIISIFIDEKHDFGAEGTDDDTLHDARNGIIYRIFVSVILQWFLLEMFKGPLPDFREE